MSRTFNPSFRTNEIHRTWRVSEPNISHFLKTTLSMTILATNWGWNVRRVRKRGSDQLMYTFLRCHAPFFFRTFTFASFLYLVCGSRTKTNPNEATKFQPIRWRRQHQVPIQRRTMVTSDGKNLTSKRLRKHIVTGVSRLFMLKMFDEGKSWLFCYNRSF